MSKFIKKNPFMRYKKYIFYKGKFIIFDLLIMKL